MRLDPPTVDVLGPTSSQRNPVRRNAKNVSAGALSESGFTERDGGHPQELDSCFSRKEETITGTAWEEATSYPSSRRRLWHVEMKKSPIPKRCPC